jgi:hypothetical protein
MSTQAGAAISGGGISGGAAAAMPLLSNAANDRTENILRGSNKMNGQDLQD